MVSLIHSIRSWFVSTIGGSADSTALAQDLQAWCNEKIGTPEHRRRQEASQRIQKAFEENSNSLILSTLELTSLPACIDRLQRLKELDVSDNRLTELQDLSALQNLEVLRVPRNQLRKLPNSIGNLQRLKLLDVSENQLPELPYLMRKLRQLEELNISGNQLTELSNLSTLPNLEWLDVSKNQLTWLSDSLARLPHIHRIQAEGNRLSEASVRTFQEAIRNAHQQNPTHSPPIDFSIDEGHVPLQQRPFLRRINTNSFEQRV